MWSCNLQIEPAMCRPATCRLEIGVIHIACQFQSVCYSGCAFKFVHLVISDVIYCMGGVA